MKLDRNINKDGKGKYALVRLRNINKGDEAYALLARLHELGHLDWGCTGQPDEFFVIKLRDKYSPNAITAYSDAVMKDSSRHEQPKCNDLVRYALDVQKLAERAGMLNDFCKEPD